MKQILKIFENIIKIVFTYIVLPFIISTSIITIIDMFNGALSYAFPTMSSLFPFKNVKFINVIDSIFKNSISLLVIVSAMLTITKIEITCRNIKKIKLENVMYINANKNYKENFNGSCFYCLRI